MRSFFASPLRVFTVAVFLAGLGLQLAALAVRYAVWRVNALAMHFRAVDALIAEIARRDPRADPAALRAAGYSLDRLEDIARGVKQGNKARRQPSPPSPSPPPNPPTRRPSSRVPPSQSPPRCSPLPHRHPPSHALLRAGLPQSRTPSQQASLTAGLPHSRTPSLSSSVAALRLSRPRAPALLPPPQIMILDAPLCSRACWRRAARHAP